MAFKTRVRNGMTSVDEADDMHISTDFLTGAGVADLSTDFIVTQNTGSDRNTLITTGNAYVRNSSYVRSQGTTRFMTGENDGQVTLAIDVNTTLATRVDIVCIKYDPAVSPSADGSNNVLSVVNVKGITTGVMPALPLHHIPLSRIDLPLNFTAVTNAMLIDMRVESNIYASDWNLVAKSDDPLAVGGTLAIVQFVTATSIKISGDWRNKIGLYSKIRFNNPTTKYFVVMDGGTFASSYTTYTIDSGSLFPLISSLISRFYYSQMETPIGFPDSMKLLSNTAPTTGIFSNTLINSNFDIWQTGTTISNFSGSVYYGPDNWESFRTSFTAGMTISRQDGTSVSGSQYCIRVQRNSGDVSTSQFQLYQNIESSESIKFRGKKATLSFWARAGANYSAGSSVLNVQIRSGTGTDQNNRSGFTGVQTVGSSAPTLTTSWQKFTLTTSANIANTVNQLAISFLFNPLGTAGVNDYYEILQVQFNAGDIALPYSPKNIEEEIRACRRLYRVDGSTSFGIWLSGTVVRIMISYGSPMRIVPVRTLIGTIMDIERTGQYNRNTTNATLLATGGLTSCFWNISGTWTGTATAMEQHAQLNNDVLVSDARF